jgi:mycothiol synthase
MVVTNYTLHSVTLPDAPTIPGLAFRGFRGESDYPKMLAVIAGSKGFDQIERADTVEDIARKYAHLPNSDPTQDMLFAEVNSEVIAYSRVSWFDVREGMRIYQHFAFMLPEWRRKGLGRAILHYNERRLRQIAVGQAFEGPRLFDTEVFESEVGRIALLKSEGYEPARYEFVMVRPNLEDLPEAPLPPGLEVRPVKPEHYAAIHAASMEAFQDHWGFSEAMEEDIEETLENPDNDPGLWRVAWDGDQVAGMVLSFIDHDENRVYNRKRGWTEDISVRRPWRKRGLASALIVQSMQALKERGMTEAALGVDGQNLSGALQLYERLGYRVVKRAWVYRKPME